MSPTSPTPTGRVACRTAFGWVGIAWSARGLAGLCLPQPSEEEALRPFPAPAAAPPAPPPGLDVSALADKLRRYFDGQAVALDEPLDPAVGTPFQQRVWSIVRAIPRGRVSTYAQVARQAGSPAAARAVGQAMARNPWPVVVPCHRVLGSDGRLTGFGGGLDMKRRMLDMERSE